MYWVNKYYIVYTLNICQGVSLCHRTKATEGTRERMLRIVMESVWTTFPEEPFQYRLSARYVITREAVRQREFVYFWTGLVII